MSYQDFRAVLRNCGGLRETAIFNFLWYTGVRTKEIIAISLFPATLLPTKTQSGSKKLSFPKFIKVIF